ncbi:MAG: heme exporter protein CcmB [Cyclobacteriaceae bacterium]|nr:heme exporter protein CcmB [Cyclobacteriaceae bacterium]
MKDLILQQLRSDLRKRASLLSLGLYLTGLVCINYFSLIQQGTGPIAFVWSSLFWMTLLFTFINTSGKSFLSDRPGIHIFFYSIASPAQIILARILHNFILSLLLALTGCVLFSVLLTSPIKDTVLFVSTIALAAFGFSATLTLLSAIASKTNNGNVIMAILSFPVTIGILLLSIKVTKNCIDGLDRSASFDELLILGAINVLVTAVSYLLFPYIWRS